MAHKGICNILIEWIIAGEKKPLYKEHNKVTKEECGMRLENNMADLVQRLRNESYKLVPT